MAPFRQFVRKHWLLILSHIGALIPIIWLVWNFQQGNLINPVDDLTEVTGKAALVFLILSLACTPANILFGFRAALKVRKTLGLYAFTYAALHLLVFVGLDYGFSLEFILQDALLTKRYIIVGFSALLILLPLAITSTRGWMRRLGRNWKKLHRLVYVAGILAVLHFAWLVKFDLSEPLAFAVVLAILLLVRVPPIRRRLSYRHPRSPANSPNVTDPSARFGATGEESTLALKSDLQQSI